MVRVEPIKLGNESTGKSGRLVTVWLHLHQQRNASLIGLADKFVKRRNRRGVPVLSYSQRESFGFGELIHVSVLAGQPLQSDIVHHDQAAVAGLLDISLDHVCSGGIGSA